MYTDFEAMKIPVGSLSSGSLACSSDAGSFLSSNSQLSDAGSLNTMKIKKGGSFFMCRL
jgi:hypothetical protein